MYIIFIFNEEKKILGRRWYICTFFGVTHVTGACDATGNSCQVVKNTHVSEMHVVAGILCSAWVRIEAGWFWPMEKLQSLERQKESGGEKNIYTCTVYIRM